MALTIKRKMNEAAGGKEEDGDRKRIFTFIRESPIELLNTA
jgi:hypothetical protein